MNGLRRLLAIMRKEVRQLRRDRLTFGMIVGIPLLQITLFGFAINTDVRDLRAGVANQSTSQLARWLVADAAASQVIRIVHQVDTPEQLETLIRRGEIAVGVFIPEDFTRRLQDPEHRPAAQLLIDGSDPLILATARQLANLETGHRIETPRPQKTETFSIRPYFNPERRSALYIVPGLTGVILTMTMVLFTAVSIVRERERGNLELLTNTPVGKTELMVGKITPLYPDRAGTGVADPGSGGVFVPCSGQWPTGGCVPGRPEFYRSQPDHGTGYFHPGQKSVSGHADHLFLFPALNTVVRLHVPFRRHAANGPVDCRIAATDPLHPPDSRHPAAGGGYRGTLARNRRPGGIQRGHADPGGSPLPQNPGLSQASPIA